MKVNDVLQCSFSSWYGPFSSLTIGSAVLPLTTNVLEYLAADGIFVDGSVGHHSDGLECSVQSCCADGKSDHKTLDPEFKQKVNNAITNLGGEVFPKLNWSSPKDAAWISPTHSLKCTNVDDIFVLLKSSDFIVHDLTEPFLECVDVSSEPVEYVLVLRKWVDLDKATEFRCFVKEGVLVAISQRHADLYFSSLAESEGHQSRLTKSLVSFFEANIKSKFPLANYVFDAYFDVGNKIILLDFNPWGIVTDSLLFTWDELNALGVGQGNEAAATVHKIPELRVITDVAIRPTDPFDGLHGVPLEYHRLAMDMGDSGKAPIEALLDMMQDQKLSDEEDMQEQ